MNQIELLHLPVRQQVPALGSHRFTLRSGCRIEEIAILIDGVLYYTLPCIATLVFPEPDKWKKSWETVYRSLMPHRHNIIEDEQRVKSVSELPFSPLPCRHNSLFSLASAKRAGPIFARPNGRITSSCPTRRTPGRTSSGSSSRSGHVDCYRTQSNSPFFWAHNTNMHAAINILRDEELVRPSKWQMQPLPNRDYTNWSEVWLPPMGFYCRGSLQSHDAAVKAAAQFAGVHSDRPICIGGSARLRQPHCTIPRGGTYADIAASHYYDCIHAQDGRWKLRSSIAVPSYVGMFR